MRAVQVMKLGGDPDTAVDYAYRFLRLHFGSVEAHRALAMSMMPGPSSPSYPPTLDVVGPDAAVCYQELTAPELKWVVLEGTDSTPTATSKRSRPNQFSRKPWWAAVLATLS